MGRLFWKVFIGFWLTMLIIAAVAALAVIAAQRSHTDDAQDIASVSARQSIVATGRRVENLLSRQAVILRHGGEAALRELFSIAGQSRWSGRAGRAPRIAARSVRIVNDAGKDLLQRPVPERALIDARRRAQQKQPGVRVVTSLEGNRFLMFVPRTSEMRTYRQSLPWYRKISPQAIAICGLVFSVLFSGLLAWYMARPIQALRNGFNRVAAGELDTRVAGQIGARRDELADLGTHFDQTIERLQQLIQSQQRLLHDVSHELRSPLARIQAAIGLMQQNPERTEQMLQRVERESTRLDTLVGEILTLARLDEKSGHGKYEAFDLDDMIADIAADARFEATERALQITVTGHAGHINGYPNLLQRAIENLVRNAIKYTMRGTEIAITLNRGFDAEKPADANATRRESVHITIRDHGPGIPDELLDAITEPFVRAQPSNPPTAVAQQAQATQNDGERFADPGASGESARPSMPAGFGLGLAIARRAVDIHHGQLTFANLAGGGLAASITIPAGPTRPNNAMTS